MEKEDLRLSKGSPIFTLRMESRMLRGSPTPSFALGVRRKKGRKIKL